jgi:4-alpha-glucanotransferase
VRIAQLRELARLYSIQVTYEDAAGKKRNASRDALHAALRMRLSPEADLKQALEDRKRAFWQRMLEPVIVVWGRRAPLFELRLPVAERGHSLEWDLRLEDGTTRSGAIDLASLANGWIEDDYAGLTVTLPERVPHGYHTLRVTVGGRSAETLIIAAPNRAPSPKNERAWGVFMPLYAARTKRSWGIGDLGDMQAHRTWINELGGGVVATLPLLAAFEDEPSPYSPLSRLFWNELYLEVEKLPEYRPGDRDEHALRHLQNLKQVDYEAVGKEKRRVLELLAARFQPDGDFEAWARQGAYAYAHFRAASEDRESAPYHLYVQYRMAQQMREVADDARSTGIGLYLDFPLGVNPGGFDAWKYASVFAKGVSVGAPPDLFFTKGQNWGFPPFDPDAIREHRYEYFRACLRHHTSHAGILRLDHVMGLHRLFWIPEGGEAKDGLYVRYAEEEFYAIITLEATRAQCVIVGEDLGTVPQYVPRMMNRHGLRRMYVVQYEVKPEGDEPMSEPAKESVASINTHDMPTFASFWSAKDADDRRDQGLLDRKGAEDEHEKRAAIRSSVARFLEARGLLQNADGDTKGLLEALLQFLSASPAEIVLVNLEDLWLEGEPQNVPGVPQRSWKQKFRFTLEQMRADDAIARELRGVNEKRREVDGHQT